LSFIKTKIKIIIKIIKVSSTVTPLESTSELHQIQSPSRLTKELPALARACDRHKVSDRSAAAIASAVLQDFGLITTDNSENVIDRSKIRRARKKVRTNLQHRIHSDNSLKSIYFDGRKDKTMVNIKKGSKYYRQSIVEEHLSLIKEPDSKYIGHVTPKSGTAHDIKRAIVEYLAEMHISADKIVAVGVTEQL